MLITEINCNFYGRGFVKVDETSEKRPEQAAGPLHDNTGAGGWQFCRFQTFQKIKGESY
jgi:hypothetical protein